VRKRGSISLRKEVEARIALLERAILLEEPLKNAKILLQEALKGGKKILVFGNGGSAADAQHFVCELVGRYKRERTGLPAIALSSDPSVVTAVSNDYGYARVFARQVEALGTPGDVAIAITTSGRSENVLQGARKAKEKGLRLIALLGKNPSPLKSLSDVVLTVSSEDTPLIQEIHTMLLHLLAKGIEQSLGEEENL